MHKLKLITRFYNGIFLANFLVTLSCLYLMRMYGPNAVEILWILLWYKIISIAIIFYAFVNYRKNELYYYQNLGITQLQLIISTSIFDFMLWLAAVILHMDAGIPAYIFNGVTALVLLFYLYQYTKK